MVRITPISYKIIVAFILFSLALSLGYGLNFKRFETAGTLLAAFFLVVAFNKPFIPFYLFLLFTPVFNPGVNLGPFTIYLGPILILLSLLFFWIRNPYFAMSTSSVSTPINNPYLLLTGIAIVSMFKNFHSGVSFRGIFLLLQPFIVLLIIVRSLKKSAEVKNILYLFVMGGMLGALLGILQYLLPHVFIRYTNTLEQYCIPLYHGYVAPGVPRVNGMFGDANTYGQFLVQVIIFAFGLFLVEKSTKRKFYLLGTLLICLVALGLSYSRGAWFSMLAGTLLSWVLMPKVIKKLKATVIIILMFFFLIQVVPDFTPRFISFFNPYESSRVTRLQQYKDIIAGISEHPFLGRGVGFYQYQGQLQAAAHNIYLNLADEIGIPGLLVFLWILFVVVRDSIGFLRKTEDESAKVLVAILISGIVAFFGHGVVGNKLYSVKIGWIPGFAMGLIYSLRRMSFNRRQVARKRARFG